MKKQKSDLIGRWQAEDDQSKVSLDTNEVEIKRLEVEDENLAVNFYQMTDKNPRYQHITLLMPLEPDVSYIFVSREIDIKAGTLKAAFGLFTHPFAGEKRDPSRLYGSFKYQGPYRKEWHVRLCKISEE